MQQPIQQFEQYYINERFNGRKLIWMHSLSRAVLRTNYLSQSYELQVSGMQLALLLFFNEQDHYTVQELTSLVDMSTEDAQTVVQSFIRSNMMLTNQQLQLSDQTLSLNYNFSSQHRKVLLFSFINVNQQPLSQEETEKTYDQVTEDRKYAIQATIVRIMKTRKKMQHQDLLAEVLLQTKLFAPALSDIKRSIQSLIEQDYLDRDSKDKNTYIYMA